MRIIEGIRSLNPPISRSVVTIGNFDGVHLGHRELLQRVLAEAARLKADSVAMTFQPHPRQVLFPERPFFRLFSFEDQASQFREMGFTYLVLEPFSRDLSELAPDRFLDGWIGQPFNPVKVIVGYDFSFGANRTGNLTILETWCKKHQVELEIVPPFQVGGQIVSSSLVRAALESGRVDQAWEWLGRPFFLEGVVIKGVQRGRKLGFPTANIDYAGEAVPRTGVYSGWVEISGRRMRAVANVGRNPTFELEATRLPRVEVHVLDFQGDLYGTRVRFLFDQFVREEKKFSSIQELADQIKKDVELARQKS